VRGAAARNPVDSLVCYAFWCVLLIERQCYFLFAIRSSFDLPKMV